MSELRSSPRRWALLAGVWLIYTCFGLAIAALAPLVHVVTAELHIGLAAMGAILGAWPLVYIFAAIPAGSLLDRFGLRRALLAGALLMALSCALRAAAWDGASLFAAVAVFGLGGALVSTGAPKLIAQYFSDAERGTAMGIYLTGPALGSILALALTHSVLMPLSGDNWRTVMLVYAGVCVLSGLIWWALAGFALRGQKPPRSAGTAASSWLAYPPLLASQRVRAVLLLAVAAFLFNHGLNNWLPAILRDGGMDTEQAGWWAALPVAIGIVGSLTIPRLASRERRLRVLLLLYLASACAVLALAWQPQPGGTLALALLARGLAGSALMPVTMLLLMDADVVNPDNMGAAGGLFFTAAEIGGVLGPLLLGLIADLAGGFNPALWLLALLMLMAMPLAAVSLRGSYRLL